MSPEPRNEPPRDEAHQSPGQRATGAPAVARQQSQPQHGEDVIHNIGYRSYEGARLGRGYARRSLFVQSLRGAYGLGRSARSKVLPMALFAVMCLPAAMVVAVALVVKAPDLYVGYNEYVLQMQPVIGIFIAAMAPQAVSLDLRFKVVPLYFSRPIERSDYVGAKFAALSAALFAFLAVPLVILYTGALLVELDFADQSAGFAQGLLFCALFSVLYAGIGLAVAALTPRRGFGVAAVIAVLTIPYMLVNALQAIAEQQDSQQAIGWLGLLSPGTLMDGLQSRFLGGDVGFPGSGALTGAQAAVYALLFVAAVAGTGAWLLRRYRKAGL